MITLTNLLLVKLYYTVVSAISFLKFSFLIKMPYLLLHHKLVFVFLTVRKYPTLFPLKKHFSMHKTMLNPEADSIAPTAR